eukprot:3709642-Amphidinium_carterae.1
MQAIRTTLTQGSCQLNELFQTMNECRVHELLAIKVPGHAGIQGNELVDQACTDVLQSPTADPAPVLQGRQIRGLCRGVAFQTWLQERLTVEPLHTHLSTLQTYVDTAVPAGWKHALPSKLTVQEQLILQQLLCQRCPRYAEYHQACSLDPPLCVCGQARTFSH